MLIGYALLIYYDCIPLYRGKQWKDFGVNVSLSIMSFVYAVLLSLGVNVPSPEGPIRLIITSIFGK